MPLLTQEQIKGMLLNKAKEAPADRKEPLVWALRQMAMQLHPDKNPNTLENPNARNDATENTKLLNASFAELNANRTNIPKPSPPPPSPEWLEQARAQNAENMRKAAEWAEQMKPGLKAQMEKFGQHPDNFDLKPDPRDLETKLKGLAGTDQIEGMNPALGNGQSFLFTYPKYDPNDAEIINKKPGYAAIDMTGTEPCVRFDPDDQASLVAALVAFKNTIGQDRDDVKIDRASLYADGEEKGKEREANLQAAIQKVNEMGIKLDLNLTGGSPQSALTVVEPAKADGNLTNSAGETATAARTPSPEPRARQQRNLFIPRRQQRCIPARCCRVHSHRTFSA